MGPKDIREQSRQVVGRASAKALRCKDAWGAQGMAVWHHGVQAREDSGWGQGSGGGDGGHR